MNNIKDITWESDVSLKNLNTYKIESKCKYLVNVLSIDGLIGILKYLNENKIPYFILGNGSNVILDEYFNGAIIKLSGLNKIEIKDKLVIAEAGAMMPKLAKMTVLHDLTGLEWAINIPGTIGGSIVGNAGAYNSDIFDNLVSIKVLTKDLNIKELAKEEVKFSYRYTNLSENYLVVLEGTFALKDGNKEKSLEIINDRCQRRKVTQPLEYPSAGSVFRNPDNDHAGRLIEDCGLKGKKIGGAMVSFKHANFIINDGSATAKDIKELINFIKKEVKEKFGVDLVLEQKIIEWK